MKTPIKEGHCAWCGTAFAAGLGWPRTCESCGKTSYVNPIPVAVVLVPIDGGLLAIRRTIEPGKGLLALPGGFMDRGETWQQAAARELREETGLAIDPAEVELFSVGSALEAGVLIVFCLARPRRRADLPAFRATDETSEAVVLDHPETLAFKLHTEAAREFFRGRRGHVAPAAGG